jgi:hypothetical protein
MATLVCGSLSRCASSPVDGTTGDPTALVNGGSVDFSVTGAVNDHVDAHYAIWDSLGGDGLSGPGIDLGNVATGTPALPVKPKAVFFFPMLTGAPDSVINQAFRAGATTTLQQLPGGAFNFRVEYDDGPANVTWTATDGQFSISQATPAHLAGSFTFHATSSTHAGQITVSGTFDAVDDPNPTGTAAGIRSSARPRPRAPFSNTP